MVKGFGVMNRANFTRKSICQTQMEDFQNIWLFVFFKTALHTTVAELKGCQQKRIRRCEGFCSIRANFMLVEWIIIGISGRAAFKVQWILFRVTQRGFLLSLSRFTPLDHSKSTEERPVKITLARLVSSLQYVNTRFLQLCFVSAG